MHLDKILSRFPLPSFIPLLFLSMIAPWQDFYHIPPLVLFLFCPKSRPKGEERIIGCFSDRLIGTVRCFDPHQLSLKELEREYLEMI